ncbi:MAG TPA: GNAT family N-acetyltransferase [Gaiellaceae bacterium]|nr:GNAT family N-acetyltransferase [Gaiellaceae bacterium]
MTVRRAVVEDASAIAAVHVGTWQAAYAHVFGAERLAGLDVARRAGFWREWIGGGRANVFVAEEEGRVVAFASVGANEHEPELGELYAIYALPEAWGTGAGPALMAAALDALREAGFAEAILWVLSDNPRARRFYEREGWTADGAEREDELLGIAVAETRYRIEL